MPSKEEKKKQRACPSMPVWMTTFTDMTTLLLTFFILMFTIAEVDGYELRLILSSFIGSFGVMEGGLTLQEGPLAEMGMTVESLPSKEAANRLEKAYKEAKREFEAELTAKLIKITSDSRGFVVSIPGQTYFKPGSYVLKDSGKVLLSKISHLLFNLKVDMDIDNQVEIEGHASLEPDTVLNSAVGVSDIWERNLDLSSNRAKVVEKFLIKEYLVNGLKPIIIIDGKQEAKFVSKGYGEFQPLEENDTPEQRAWNRRVDIVVKHD